MVEQKADQGRYQPAAWANLLRQGKQTQKSKNLLSTERRNETELLHNRAIEEWSVYSIKSLFHLPTQLLTNNHQHFINPLRIHIDYLKGEALPIHLITSLRNPL